METTKSFPLIHPNLINSALQDLGIAPDLLKVVDVDIDGHTRLVMVYDSERADDVINEFVNAAIVLRMKGVI
jgi:hypothetical protein